MTLPLNMDLNLPLLCLCSDLLTLCEFLYQYIFFPRNHQAFYDTQKIFKALHFAPQFWNLMDREIFMDVEWANLIKERIPEGIAWGIALGEAGGNTQGDFWSLQRERKMLL